MNFIEHSKWYDFLWMLIPYIGFALMVISIELRLKKEKRKNELTI